VTELLRGGHTALDPRLGRLPEFDDRSWNWPIRGLLATEVGTAKPPLRSFTWPAPWEAMNQLRTGHCVGFGHGGRAKGSPILHPEVDNDWCHRYYKRCQDLDEWAGSETEEPTYEGSSVIAGSKTGIEWGIYESYWWGVGVEDAARGVGYVAPGVAGTVWLDGMFDPRPSGLLEVSGSVAGGHCYLVRGIRLRAVLPGEGPTPLEMFRIRNSWGPKWGIAGDAFIKVEDFERLQKMDGEICFPVEPRQHRTEV